MSTPHICWDGQSWKEYRYWIHLSAAKFKKIAGNIIFAKQADSGAWGPIYTGQTRDFDEGSADPDKVECAKSHGATHLHAHFSSPDAGRCMAEKADLIAKWQPVCNQ